MKVIGYFILAAMYLLIGERARNRLLNEIGYFCCAMFTASGILGCFSIRWVQRFLYSLPGANRLIVSFIEEFQLLEKPDKILITVIVPVITLLFVARRDAWIHPEAYDAEKDEELIFIFLLIPAFAFVPLFVVCENLFYGNYSISAVCIFPAIAAAEAAYKIMRQIAAVSSKSANTKKDLEKISEEKNEVDI